MEIGSRAGIAEIFPLRLLIAVILMETEMGTAPIVAGNVAVSIRPSATASPTSATRARNKVIGANDVDQVKQLTADWAVQNRDTSHGSINGFDRRGILRISGSDGHGTSCDTEQPVRKRDHASVQANVGNGDVDGDRSEWPGHKRAGTGRNDLLCPWVSQGRAATDQDCGVLT